MNDNKNSPKQARLALLNQDVLAVSGAGQKHSRDPLPPQIDRGAGTLDSHTPTPAQKNSPPPQQQNNPNTGKTITLTIGKTKNNIRHFTYVCTSLVGRVSGTPHF